jgi:hypothetical protein
MALTLPAMLFLAGFAMSSCYFYVRPAHSDPEYDLDQLQLADRTIDSTAVGSADVYILTSRTAQSQAPFLLKKIRKILPCKGPAFTKHWAIRVTWANGDDKVWQIFQADKMVLSPKCSDHNTVRMYFDRYHHVGRTYHSMNEISKIGSSAPDIILDHSTQNTDGLVALAARNNTKEYHLITSNCQTFVLEVIKKIVVHSSLDDTLFENTVMMGIGDPEWPIAFGSLLLMLAPLGMLPLALRIFSILISGADVVESGITHDCIMALCVCVGKLLRTDTRFVKQRSTFGYFVVENRDLMYHIDIYGAFRLRLAILEFAIDLLASGTTHLVLKDGVRTTLWILWLQTGFVLQMLACAVFPATVKDTIQTPRAVSSLPAKLKDSSTISSGHSNLNAVRGAKHDQRHEHQNLPRPTDRTGENVTDKVAELRRLMHVEQQNTSLVVRRKPRRRHRVIVLDVERESCVLET